MHAALNKRCPSASIVNGGSQSDFCSRVARRSERTRSFAGDFVRALVSGGAIASSRRGIRAPLGFGDATLSSAVAAYSCGVAAVGGDGDDAGSRASGLSRRAAKVASPDIASSNTAHTT
jgi:hypothetical protein